MSNVIQLDLHEVADIWKALQSFADEETGVYDDEVDRQREREFKSLCDELGVAATPNDLRWLADKQGLTLIREDTFTDYAQKFAESVYGDAVEDLSWCIDWEKYASSMRQDYYSLTYDGHEWLRRA